MENVETIGFSGRIPEGETPIEEGMNEKEKKIEKLKEARKTKQGNPNLEHGGVSATERRAERERERDWWLLFVCLFVVLFFSCFFVQGFLKKLRLEILTAMWLISSLKDCSRRSEDC
jgi:hypothetical protein